MAISAPFMAWRTRFFRYCNCFAGPLFGQEEILRDDLDLAAVAYCFAIADRPPRRMYF
jgi:hypothetical protein